MNYNYQQRSLITNDIDGAQPKELHPYLNRQIPDFINREEVLIPRKANQPQQNFNEGRRRYKADMQNIPYQIIPEGDEFFTRGGKKHFKEDDGEIKSTSAMQNIYDQPNPMQHHLDRALQTRDIEGAIPGTLISKVVKNKETAMRIKFLQQQLQYEEYGNRNKMDHSSVSQQPNYLQHNYIDGQQYDQKSYLQRNVQQIDNNQYHQIQLEKKQQAQKQQEQRFQQQKQIEQRYQEQRQLESLQQEQRQLEQRYEYRQQEQKQQEQQEQKQQEQKYQEQKYQEQKYQEQKYQEQVQLEQEMEKFKEFQDQKANKYYTQEDILVEQLMKQKREKEKYITEDKDERLRQMRQQNKITGDEDQKLNQLRNTIVPKQDETRVIPKSQSQYESYDNGIQEIDVMSMRNNVSAHETPQPHTFAKHGKSIVSPNLKFDIIGNQIYHKQPESRIHHQDYEQSKQLLGIFNHAPHPKYRARPY